MESSQSVVLSRVPSADITTGWELSQLLPAAKLNSNKSQTPPSPPTTTTTTTNAAASAHWQTNISIITAAPSYVALAQTVQRTLSPKTPLLLHHAAIT
jgi:hypothetical protein